MSTDPQGTVRSDQRTLRQLHAQLRAACSNLVDPTLYEDARDDGTMQVVEGDSLLTQLADAAGSSSMSGGARSKSQPIPISPDAVDLFAEIEARTAEWGPEPTVEARIRTGVNMAGGYTSEADVSWVLGRLERWVTQITDLFNPRRKFHVVAPCPACGTRMVRKRDEATGDVVQVPALDLVNVSNDPNHPEFECTCLNPGCRQKWPSGNLEHLALVIDQERAEHRTKSAGEPLALWRDGSIHRLPTAASNMAGPVESFDVKSEGGSAA